ncbi:hypothetical protein D3C72_1400240 [compost metagenome]
MQLTGVAVYRLVGFELMMANQRLYQVFGRHCGMLAGAHLGAAQAEPSGKHGKKAVGLNQLRTDIGQGNQGQRQVIVGRQRAVIITNAQRQAQAADALTHGVTERQACQHRPEQIMPGPMQQGTGTGLCLGNQQQTEQYKGEGHTIVEPRLTGQAKAQGILIRGITDLHQRGQYRVGGGEYGRDQ